MSLACKLCLPQTVGGSPADGCACLLHCGSPHCTPARDQAGSFLEGVTARVAPVTSLEARSIAAARAAEAAKARDEERAAARLSRRAAKAAL
jgi:hypothetical protein